MTTLCFRRAVASSLPLVPLADAFVHARAERDAVPRSLKRKVLFDDRRYAQQGLLSVDVRVRQHIDARSADKGHVIGARFGCRYGRMVPFSLNELNEWNNDLDGVCR